MNRCRSVENVYNAIKTGGTELPRDESGGYLLTAQVVAGMKAA